MLSKLWKRIRGVRDQQPLTNAEFRGDVCFCYRNPEEPEGWCYRCWTKAGGRHG